MAMKSRLRHLLAGSLTTLLSIGIILLSTTFIIYYVNQTLGEIKHALPLSLSQQESDIDLLLNDVKELIHSVKLSQINHSTHNHETTINLFNKLEDRLIYIRDRYSFNDLIGATEIHAAVNPAVIDIKLWLNEGVYNFAPDSLVTLKLVDQRLSGSLNEAQKLYLAISRKTLDILKFQSNRIEELQNATVITIAIFSLMSFTLIYFVLRQQSSALKLKRSEERLKDAIESITEGFVLWDSEDRMVICNSQYKSFYPLIRDQLVPGITFEAVVNKSALNNHYKTDESVEDNIKNRIESHLNPGDSREQLLSDGRCLLVTEQRTTEGGIVGIRTDITALKKAQEQIRFRANFDPLTRLPNRANFMDHLDQEIKSIKRLEKTLVLLYIDLDRFKAINDTLGHSMGDKLLVEVAHRLNSCVRNTDMVARLGGDEFTIILSDISDEMHASLIAEKIIALLSKPFFLEGHDIYTGASIGITVCPLDGDDTSTLLKNADMAMYQSKEMGRNTFQFFTPQMTNLARHFLEIDKDLRRALEQNELFLTFQPILDLEQNLLAGVEVLLRWEHPQKGLIMPDTFIPVAEETGLIVEIGEWVLRQSCIEAMKWREMGHQHIPYLAVNISIRQFKGGFCWKRVKDILNQTGYPAKHLVLEITESLLIDKDLQLLNALDELKESGIRLAVDDFGTGYSSLNYLRCFPVSIVKIDRDFVRDMDVNESDARLVDAIISMARALNLKVVADGVEKEEHKKLLSQMKCDLLQGYFYSKPLTIDKLTQVLNDNPGGVV
ncbi:MAG: EAL domain-containing protein [Gammaproteobacteria bacterium]|nr:EAL domain-containing protein [Gammaproteobacteria bacterium]